MVIRKLFFLTGVIWYSGDVWYCGEVNLRVKLLQPPDAQLAHTSQIPNHNLKF